MKAITTTIGTPLCAALAMMLIGLWSHPAGAAPCDAKPETTKITIMGDWLPWALQGPMFDAIRLGHYKDEGLDVELVSPATPADTVKLLATQEVEFAITYVPEIMMARDAADIPVVSVAAMYRYHVGGLVIPGDGSIKTARGLRGKTIGVNNFPTAMAELKTLLDFAGLTEDDVEIVDPGYGGMALFVDGKIDADWGFTTVNPPIVNPMLESVGKPPMEFLRYRDHGLPDYYHFVLGANEDWLKKNPATACRFLRATEKGIATFTDDPKDSLEQMVAQSDLFSIENQWAIFRNTKNEWFSASGEVFVQDVAIWQETQIWALKYGLLEKKIDPTVYFTNDYLP